MSSATKRESPYPLISPILTVESLISPSESVLAGDALSLIEEAKRASATVGLSSPIANRQRKQPIIHHPTFLLTTNGLITPLACMDFSNFETLIKAAENTLRRPGPLSVPLGAFQVVELA